MWLLVYVVGAQQWATLAMGLIPARLSGIVELPGALPALLTPLSSTLVHAGFFHLALNLIMLLWCGSLVERILGTSSLLLIYVVGAFAAAIAQWLSYPTSLIPVVGASGAISAVIGAFALSFGQQKRIVRSERLNRLLNALWLLAAWVVLQMIIGWMAGMQGLLIAVPAHIGGFIAGVALQRPLLMWRYRTA